MTREYRARVGAGKSGPKRVAMHAAVRVRLPEGILLQGEFNAGEPVGLHLRCLNDWLVVFYTYFTAFPCIPEHAPSLKGPPLDVRHLEHYIHFT